MVEQINTVADFTRCGFKGEALIHVLAEGHAGIAAAANLASFLHHASLGTVLWAAAALNPADQARLPLWGVPLR